MKGAVILTRLSTVVLTDEPRANVRACGFASGGRYADLMALLYTWMIMAYVDLVLVEVNTHSPRSYRRSSYL